jgi:hypothetical protein
VLRGTHSVLDVEAVVAEPFGQPWHVRMSQQAATPFKLNPAEQRNGILVRCGKVAPCSERQLCQLFGTTTPTRAAVEAALERLLDLIGRGEGRYGVAYRENRPAEIVFAGCSAIKLKAGELDWRARRLRGGSDSVNYAATVASTSQSWIVVTARL